MNKRRIVLDYHVERGDQEIVLEVHGLVSFGYPAYTAGLPENSYPAEDDIADIEGILLNGMPWDGELSSSEEDVLVQMLLDAANDTDDLDPPSDDGRDDEYENNLSDYDDD